MKKVSAFAIAFVLSLLLVVPLQVAPIKSDGAEQKSVVIVDLSNLDLSSEASLREHGITILNTRPSTVDESYQLQKNTGLSANAAKAAQTYTVVQNWTETYPSNNNFVTEMQAILTLTSAGAHTQIDAVNSVGSSLDAGINEPSWTQINSSSRSMTGSYPTGRAEIIVTGKFSCTVGKPSGDSVSIPRFIVSSASSTMLTTYTSNSMIIKREYKTY